MSEAPVFDAANRLQQAKILHREGRLEEAQQLYGEVLAQAPDDADALHYLGILKGQAGDLEAAAALLARAAEMDPANGAIHYNLGNALRQRGRLDEALRRVPRAIGGGAGFGGRAVSLRSDSATRSEAIRPRRR